MSASVFDRTALSLAELRLSAATVALHEAKAEQRHAANHLAYLRKGQLS